jgi:hypothetical protein
MLLPKPYPDEVIGSVLARASFQTGLRQSTLTTAIVGRSRSYSSFLMSSDIPTLAVRCGVDAEELLEKHTVFPYAVAFTRSAERNRLKSKALSLDTDRETLSSLTKSVTHGLPGRRLCPQCVKEDMMLYGESYWRRAHLLPGVSRCTLHDVTLRVASLPDKARRGDGRLPHEVQARRPRYDRPLETYAGLNSLSVSVLAPRNTSDKDFLAVYRTRARDLGYVLPSGNLASSALASAVSLHFGSKYLTDMGCAIDTERVSPWPTLIVREGHETPFATGKHIIMQAFLDAGIPAPADPATCYRSPGKRPQDYRRLDARTAERVRTALKRLAKARQRTTVRDLMSGIGVWSAFRHDRCAFPETAALLQAFRASDQSVRQLGRRAYWRERLGLDSKEAT